MGVLNRVAIKQEARAFLGIDKKWGKMFFAVLIFYIFQGAYGAASFILEYHDKDSSVFFIFSLISLPFTVAVAGYFLNWLRGFNPDAKSLYKEGIDNFGKYFAGIFLTYLSIYLWALLFIIPGLIKVFEYSQVRYILHDNNKIKASQAKKMSSIMTNGYKSELFVLELSFIGWYMLGALTMGIAFIYVIPYMETVRAMYYENLKSNAIEKGLIAPEAFMSEPPIYNGFEAQPDFRSPYDIAEDYSRQMNNQPHYFGTYEPTKTAEPTEKFENSESNEATPNTVSEEIEESEETQEISENTEASDENDF